VVFCACSTPNSNFIFSRLRLSLWASQFHSGATPATITVDGAKPLTEIIIEGVYRRPFQVDGAKPTLEWTRNKGCAADQQDWVLTELPKKAPSFQGGDELGAARAERGQYHLPQESPMI